VNARRSSEELVAELAGALEPVRPIAPLRGQLVGVALAWVATAAALWAFAGMGPATLGRGGVSALVLAALAAIGFAGITVGLAARIPGREAVVRAGVAVIGLGAALLIALAAWLAATPIDPGLFASSQRCMDRSFLLAMPSAAMAAYFAARGAPWRAFASAMGVAIGASALGGLAVHLTCVSPNAWHWLLAHALVPAFGGASIGLATSWLIKRRRDAREARR
jgi:hypothetical protein